MTLNRKLLAGALLGALPFAALADEIITYVEPAPVYYYSSGEPVYYEPVYYYPRESIVVERRYMNDDALITNDVKAALDADPRLDSSRISVETERGSVALSGLVTTPGKVAIARRDAMEVPGVSEVRNYLRPKVGPSGTY